MRWAARFTDHIVAVSRPIAHYVQEAAPDAAGRICIIPNGVDLRRFSQGLPMRLERLAPAQKTSGRFVIGHVARLDRVKNQALLLRAFALVAKELPHVQLAIAGDGPLKAELQALAETLGIAQLVRFYGVVVDIPQWLQAVDLFVLSSDAEGTPMSLLEAMASERCVVATAVGGIPDLLAHGMAGVLVPPGNAAAMASVLVELAQASDKREALAQAGRARVETSYGEDLMVRQYEALYRGRPLNAPDWRDRCVA
jgi:glycosyltransferase involved in cell wall biosynthesis